MPISNVKLESRTYSPLLYDNKTSTISKNEKVTVTVINGQLSIPKDFQASLVISEIQSDTTTHLLERLKLKSETSVCEDVAQLKLLYFAD